MNKLKVIFNSKDYTIDAPDSIVNLIKEKGETIEMFDEANEIVIGFICQKLEIENSAFISMIDCYKHINEDESVVYKTLLIDCQNAIF